MPREWPGETVFIVAGGPSVGETDLSLLAGSRVIAINSSYQVAPAADFLIFGDTRWWKLHQGILCPGPLPAGRAAAGGQPVRGPRPDCTIDNRLAPLGGQPFAGRIVTTAQAALGKQLLKLRKVEPKPGQGLTQDRQALCMQRTTLHAAINLAVHLGVARIVLLGADMGRSPDGRSHHHPAHPWAVKPGCWDEQLAQLELCAAPLDALGIAVINCSPQSRIGWWSKAKFNEVV